MESEALELFYKEAMRVKEEQGRLANWFKCKCPEYAENQFYASKRKNKIPSVAIVLQFEGYIEPAILYNLLKIKQDISYASDIRELDYNNNYWIHFRRDNVF